MKMGFKDLTNKVVVITGGSSGLGEQIAYEAAKKNATVVICARRIQLIGKVRERCEELSSQKAYAFQLDIAEPENIEEVYQKIIHEIGKIDILVNCAGFGLFETFSDFSMDIAEKMFRVNVLGLMYMTQKVAIHMGERRAGHIINVASQAGKMATPKSTVYSATKFAVIGFSNALRLELKPLGVQVTTVNPGPIETNFFTIADESGSYLSSVDWMVLKPEVLASKVVRSMGSNKREINSPLFMEMASKAYTLFPSVGDYLAGSLFNKK
ncbi:short-chain dehydrogenase [Vagococcus entomophilus]|uniref:Short-chain dehydrogenase n=2 Tax=Vagococcus entomophilus TaxID=1160095 RepID=A0A430AIR6_9ENTE|nr:SDR family oxidoreductase [Vagococcus entomophilus]RSU07981.1 short-chain dehydrogenase [Vagococcus entomophilus]